MSRRNDYVSYLGIPSKRISEELICSSGSALSFELDAPDVATMEQRIEAYRNQYPWLVFEAAGKVLGYAYASRHRERLAYQWCVEVSV